MLNLQQNLQNLPPLMLLQPQQQQQLQVAAAQAQLNNQNVNALLGKSTFVSAYLLLILGFFSAKH